MNSSDLLFTATHRQLLHPPPRLQLHPLYLYHPLRTRPQRRPGLIPRLPRKPHQHPRPHRRQALRHSLTPHVDRGIPLALRLRTSQPRLSKRSASAKQSSSSGASSYRRRTHSNNPRLFNRRHRPRRRRLRLSTARPDAERPPHRSSQPDRRAEPLRPRERPLAQRPRGRAPAPPAL